MTIIEATKAGIGKLRLRNWNPYTHIELYLCFVGGGSPAAWGERPRGDGGELHHGPWVRLYDPPSHLALGKRWDHYETLPSYSFWTEQNEPLDFEEWVPPADYERFSKETAA